MYSLSRIYIAFTHVVRDIISFCRYNHSSNIVHCVKKKTCPIQGRIAFQRFSIDSRTSLYNSFPVLKVMKFNTVRLECDQMCIAFTVYVVDLFKFVISIKFSLIFNRVRKRGSV